MLHLVPERCLNFWRLGQRLRQGVIYQFRPSLHVTEIKEEIGFVKSGRLNDWIDNLKRVTKISITHKSLRREIKSIDTHGTFSEQGNLEGMFVIFFCLGQAFRNPA